MRRKIQKYLSGEREGFSLIELIIVIAIMAILIGVVALVVLPYLESSRESTDRAALNEVATAFKSAASINSKYATTVNNTLSSAKDSSSLDADLKKKIESYLENRLQIQRKVCLLKTVPERNSISRNPIKALRCLLVQAQVRLLKTPME